MSQLNVKMLKLGISSTLNQNFVWQVPSVQDGTCSLIRESDSSVIFSVATDNKLTITSLVSPTISSTSASITTISSSVGTITTLVSTSSTIGTLSATSATLTSLRTPVYEVDIMWVNTAITGGTYVFTAAGAILPLSSTPTVGDRIKVINRSGALTCIVDPGTGKINSTVGTMTVDSLNAAFELVYVNSTIGWAIS